jgi:osmotically-inducible protein OsmY
MTNTKSDLQIETDVRDELIWDPEVNIADIGIIVREGNVTLRGTVELYGEKWAAERDVLRISGVRVLTNDLLVKPAKHTKHSDTEISQQVANTIRADWSVPNERVQVAVEDGWVTISGSTDWYFQRSAAETDARRVMGVKGVVNKIAIVQPHVSASDIQTGIKKALVRTAEVDADTITVIVEGARVTLTGTVQSWAECEAAKSAAWRAKGVTNVINDIQIRD